MKLQPMSFKKRLGFYLRGKNDTKAGVRWCPYTPNSTEAAMWWRGFEGKKRPVNPLVYTLKPRATGASVFFAR